MRISDLILTVGDDNVRFQNLDQCASDINYSAKKGTTITFRTDQACDLNGTTDLGLVIWLPRAAVAAALKSTAAKEGGE
ncbi:hypothetical protein [uncultured Brevundimonas sp.]|uniref:hypothetical protein n=1 Tax=uncultured Brevundimonas sp. TaxID=213418 RepID=UPI0025E70044|nr:hypothetical protein [uncultured Brevundimonas sp.]